MEEERSYFKIGFMLEDKLGDRAELNKTINLRDDEDLNLETLYEEFIYFLKSMGYYPKDIVVYLDKEEREAYKKAMKELYG